MHEYEIYGYSLFETFLGCRGQFWRLDEHWQRLRTAALHFGLDAPDWSDFLEQIRRVLDPSRNQVFRFTLVQEGGRWCEADLKTAQHVLVKDWAGTPGQPVSLAIGSERLACQDRQRCYKSGSRMAYQHALHTAMQQGHGDALLVDQEGYCLETTTANIAVFRNNCWVTPPLQLGVLPGIFRSWLLAQGLVQEESFCLQDIQAGTPMVAFNAVKGAFPVANLQTTPMGITFAKNWVANLPDRQFSPMD